MEEKRILVVDDEKSIRDIFSEAFSQAGFSVQTAANAEEAIKVMRASPAWVLFLDLNLPGMNGLELCRQIRHDWPLAIPYAVTGYACLFEQSGCREAGFEDYFTKPVRLTDLIEAAENAFQRLANWENH